MNTQITNSPAWPLEIELDNEGRLNVVMTDGKRVDLGDFMDDCRLRAAALRQQAIADAVDAARCAFRSAWTAVIRSAAAPSARRTATRVQSACTD